MKWFIKCLRHYADFSGRARRKEYWMFTLFNGIALFVWAFVLALLSASVGNMDDLQTIQIVIQLSWMSLMGLPGLAVSVRRLHDLGKSGWMSLIALIPIVGAVWMLVLMVTEGQTGENRFGPDPKTSPETFPDRAKLTSVGVITIIGESVSAIGTLCMVLFPVLYFGVEYPMSFIVVAQYIIPPLAMLVAGILFVGAGERERIRPALWIVLAVYAYSCIANLISMSAQMKMMSEGVPVPVSNIVGVVIYALSNLSIALVAAIALFAPHNRSAIRGSAMVAMVAGGLRLVVWISTIRISGMERLSEIFTLTYATSTIGWILLAWTLFSRKEMPVAGGSSIATAPKEPAKQATPIPTAPGKPEPAKQEAPKTGDNLNSEQKFIAEAVVSLMRLYHNSPRGEGFLTGSQSAEPVRQIGERLYVRGGHQFMVVAHQLFASSYTVMGAARNLESVWDGIGDWMG